jgi:hypothetical protein
VLPDGTTGVDLKLLANKFNTLPANERQAMAFAVGSRRFDDFADRMKDAENFFKYQQRFGGEAPTRGLTGNEVAELSSAGYLAGGYGTGKTVGLVGRLYNNIKGGLSDVNMMNFLTSPETKGLLRETIRSPNSVRTLDKIDRVLGGAPVGLPAVTGASYGARSMDFEEPAPEPWDIGAVTPQPSTSNVTVQAAPAEFNTMEPIPQEPLEEWDIGPAQ